MKTLDELLEELGARLGVNDRVRVWCQTSYQCGWTGYRRREVAEDRPCPRCGASVRMMM